MKTQGEIWTVAKLLEMYRDGMIIKPKIQRKQCWDTLTSTTPGATSESDFIAFVRMCGNLVNPLVFVQRGKYLLIDGNNRLNALVRCEKPPLDAAVPVVIFDGITDVELIHVY